MTSLLDIGAPVLHIIQLLNFVHYHHCPRLWQDTTSEGRHLLQLSSTAGAQHQAAAAVTVTAPVTAAAVIVTVVTAATATSVGLGAGRDQ